MNNFKKDDAIGRVRFKSDFNDYFMMEDTSKYAHTDIMMTGRSKNICYSTEIKNRSYCLQDISGSTYLEETKLDAFRQQYNEDNDRCLIYFNYYPDGWIAFDMSNRIRYDEGLDNQINIQLPKTSSINKGLRNKEIISICHTSNMYVQDKMCRYE